MSSSMSYSDFLDSVKQNRLHFVSGDSHPIKGMGVAHEPCYALETSGSVESKIYIHNLSSIQAASKAFFNTFKMSEDDKWGLCLSTSHVAGFSVLARTYYGKLQAPHFFDWSKESLLTEIEKHKISILSLVPTQVFDIVRMGLAAPQSLRMVFVGGAKLSKDLREDAVKLGWPIIECYGSTETFAQMSYSIGGIGFKPFDGWTVKILDGEIYVSGPGLFSGQIKNGVYRSRIDEWFGTGDVGILENEGLSVLGKKQGLIKIKGSYFDFNNLKAQFQKLLTELGVDPSTCFLACLEEERDGAGIYMISTQKKVNNNLLSSFKKIRGVFYIERVERSELGKVKASSLSSVLKKKVLSL